MTRERMIELWPVMEHFKGGGEVQVTHPEVMIWDDAHEPRWSDGCLYRIKTSPKLVPLDAEDWLQGGPWWVKGSDSHHSPCMVTTVSETEVLWSCQHGHGHRKSFEKAVTELVRRSGSDLEGKWTTCAKESKE